MYERSSSLLICVDPAKVHSFWPHAAPLLKAACSRTTLTALEDITQDVLSGRSLLWLAWDGRAIQAAAATALLNSEGYKVCVITVCAGKGMKKWLSLINEIESYARAEGCTGVRIYGRKGWARVLDGYRARHVVIEKDIRTLE